MPAPIRDLDHLLEILRAAPQEKNSHAQIEYAALHGLPVTHGEIDVTSLPTFGGAEPSDLNAVWSWDAHRVLGGAGWDDLTIVDRLDEVAGD